MAWSATVHLTTDQTTRIYGKVMASSSREAIDAASVVLLKFGSTLPDSVKVDVEPLGSSMMFTIAFSATVAVEPVCN